jgi:hypothetical protein
MNDAFGNGLVFFSLCMALIFFIGYLVSLFWVYQDAEQRGKTGCLWLLLIFFTWPFGLIAYIVLRDKNVQL